MERERRIKLGEINGIEIGIDYSWFWIFILVTYLFAGVLLPTFDPTRTTLAYIVLALFGSVLFFGSVLIHELAHAYVAKKNDLDVSTITLFLFGGVSNINEEPKNPRSELMIAAAGPFTSFVVGVIFLAISGFFLLFSTDIIWALIQYIGLINIFLAFFNMLPGFPLDGGRILRSIIWFRNKNLINATSIAANVGKILAYFLIIIGFFQLLFVGLFSGLWLILISFFLLHVAEMSLQNTIASELLKDVKVSDIMTKKAPQIDGEKNLQELEEEALKEHESYFFVTENKKVTGLSSVDVLDRVGKDNWGVKLKNIKTPLDEFPKVRENENATTAFHYLNRGEKDAIPIYGKNNKLSGLLSISDLKLFLKIKRTELRRT